MRSPALMVVSSPVTGVKWHTVLLMDMHVGKAMPFSIFSPFLLGLLKVFLRRSCRK